MKQHKYESLLKFVHLDGVKEFKETDPALFSDDGISTSTMEVEGDCTVPVTLLDVKNACEQYLDGNLTLSQFQQWGEWIHLMDFFELGSDESSEKENALLIDLITDIDTIDLTEASKVKSKVMNMIRIIDDECQPKNTSRNGV